jgi:hypothetical protein
VSNASLPTDVRDLLDQIDAARRDALAVVDGLPEHLGTKRPRPTAWSVAECIDHLATANRIYVAAMQEPARRARLDGRARRGPVRPGLIGGIFVYTLEPPPKWWAPMPAPKMIRPSPSPPLAPSFAAFIKSQDDVRAFLRDNADIDLSGVRFPNPFIPGLRFSLATGLNVITSHERRHLAQAWQVRRAVEKSAP